MMVLFRLFIGFEFVFSRKEWSADFAPTHHPTHGSVCCCLLPSPPCAPCPPLHTSPIRASRFGSPLLHCARSPPALPFLQKLGRERGQLPAIVTSILVHTFDGCRDEVKRKLQARVDGLRAFVGGTEAVYLGSGAPAASDSPSAGAANSNSINGRGHVGPNPPPSIVMAPDTQDLLYGELRRRYRTIAGLGKTELATLAAGVLCRAFKTEHRHRVGLTLVNQTWPSFEPVMRSYLALFVEVIARAMDVACGLGVGWRVHVLDTWSSGVRD